MSRTLSAGMTGHLAQRAHTRCNMLLLVLRDGTKLGITDHNKHIDFDLGSGTVQYRADLGITISDIVLQLGLDASNCEVSGPILEGSDFSQERIQGGRFTRARAYLFEVNWRNLADQSIDVMAGNASEIRIEGERFVFEIRSDQDRYNQVIGRLIVNNCDADFADGIRCFATATEVVGTVTAVTDAMNFTVSFVGSYADDFFNSGTVEALTGDLAGTQPVEIFDWTSAGVVTLFMPLVEAPAIGDTFTIKNGCDKSRAACMTFGQILNFRGFPEVPGSDQVFRPTIPGQGND